MVINFEPAQLWHSILCRDVCIYGYMYVFAYTKFVLIAVVLQILLTSKYVLIIKDRCFVIVNQIFILVCRNHMKLNNIRRGSRQPMPY